MTVIKLTGNSISLNSTATCVPLANTYLANCTSGAMRFYAELEQEAPSTFYSPMQED